MLINLNGETQVVSVGQMYFKTDDGENETELVPAYTPSYSFTNGRTITYLPTWAFRNHRHSVCSHITYCRRIQTVGAQGRADRLESSLYKSGLRDTQDIRTCRTTQTRICHKNGNLSPIYARRDERTER